MRRASVASACSTSEPSIRADSDDEPLGLAPFKSKRSPAPEPPMSSTCKSSSASSRSRSITRPTNHRTSTVYTSKSPFLRLFAVGALSVLITLLCVGAYIFFAVGSSGPGASHSTHRHPQPRDDFHSRSHFKMDSRHNIEIFSHDVVAVEIEQGSRSSSSQLSVKSSDAHSGHSRMLLDQRSPSDYFSLGMRRLDGRGHVINHERTYIANEQDKRMGFLKALLQIAAEVELVAINPYLTAFYSLVTIKHSHAHGGEHNNGTHSHHTRNKTVDHDMGMSENTTEEHGVAPKHPVLLHGDEDHEDMDMDMDHGEHNESESEGEMSTNDMISHVLHRIPAEEMLHLGLAANILSSLCPDAPRFYIGRKDALYLNFPLKNFFGDIAHLASVKDRHFSLEPLSELQVEKFLSFEKDAIAIPISYGAEKFVYHSITELYREIDRLLEACEAHAKKNGGTIFRGAPGLQLDRYYFKEPGLIVIKDLESAKQATNIITWQGEGTGVAPPDEFPVEPNHAELFASVLERVRTTDDGFETFARDDSKKHDVEPWLSALRCYHATYSYQLLLMDVLYQTDAETHPDRKEELAHGGMGELMHPLLGPLHRLLVSNGVFPKIEHFDFADNPEDLPYDQVRKFCVVARQKLDATGHGEAADFIHEETLSQLLHVTQVTRSEYERVVSLSLP